MKTSKNLSRNSLRFITLLVLSSVSLTSFTAIAQSNSKITNAYKDALTDSVKTEPGEITNNLTILSQIQTSIGINKGEYWLLLLQNILSLI
jgi:hypothetical protein